MCIYCITAVIIISIIQINQLIMIFDWNNWLIVDWTHAFDSDIYFLNTPYSIYIMKMY